MEKNRVKQAIRWLKIDCNIFSSDKSPFEALVVSLKDKERMSYHDIGVMLGRDERNIWTVYNRGKKKE